MHLSRCGKHAYVTYATSDLTAISATVLARSLKASGSKKCRLIMVSNDISWLIRPFLKKMFDEIIDVDLATPKKRILHEDYGPIWLWKVKGYKKLAYIHNSAMVLKNPDDIFTYESFSATTDVSWSDRFDTNVLLLKPNKKDFDQLIKDAENEVEDPDRATYRWVLTSHFLEWNRLPCVFNILYTLPDTNVDAYKKLFHMIKIVRFAGANMPWNVPLNIRDNRPEVNIDGVGHIYMELPFHEKWWNFFTKYVQAPLSKYLKIFNLKLVEKDNHLFLGNIDLHIDAGFYLYKNKSYPKFIRRGGVEVSNEYTCWRDLMEGIRGYQDAGLDTSFN
ncbi:glycogenin-1 isoform X2 [Patella vulgata]|uniref:glycogenin-1 isoform X2 n=1 Tax=Patella vulgata TaxID=6465 RepID=UPI0021806EE8|nr:glycogenin-1 isoform X2 [Patella vulgata]